MVATHSRATIHWAPGRGKERMAGRLHVRRLGTSGQPFLLLHGLGGSSRYWGATYDGLTAVGRIIVPDLLGFGRSERPTTGYTADDHADAVIGCLDALGVAEPAIIGAHSLGCLVALALTARHPHRVAAVVGAGSPLYADAASARAGIARLGWLERQFASGNRRARRVCSWTCGHPRTAARLARLARPSIPTPILLAAQGDAWLSAVTVPVHLLVGDHDRVPDVDHLRELAGRHQDLRVSVVNGADHDLPLTHAATIVAALRGAAPAK